MTNITLAIDEQLLEQGRTYAKRNGMSFNALVRDLITQTVAPVHGSIDDLWALMDEAGGDSRGEKWTREELYRV